MIIKRKANELKEYYSKDVKGRCKLRLSNSKL